MVKLGLFFANIPQTYIFLEFVTWLTSSMYPQRCYVMNSLREIFLQVSSLLIYQEFDFPKSDSYTTFFDETLLSFYQTCQQRKKKFVQIYFPPSAVLPSKSTQFPVTCFVDNVRPMLQIIAKILGRNETSVVDYQIIGLFHLMMQLDLY